MMVTLMTAWQHLTRSGHLDQVLQTLLLTTQICLCTWMAPVTLKEQTELGFLLFLVLLSYVPDLFYVITQH